jgi:hypothetical protein
MPVLGVTRLGNGDQAFFRFIPATRHSSPNDGTWSSPRHRDTAPVPMS